MLDKRRLHVPRSPPCTLLFVVALTITGCFSVWLLNAGPDPTISLPAVPPTPAYIVNLSENASVLPQSYSVNELPSDDEGTLIDIKNFRFTMNHDPCEKTQPLLLVLIHTAPANYPKRMVIRETWGQRRVGVAMLFLLGQTEEYQDKLEEEDREYGDIVQGNFYDAYRNMTYKHVMALKWATYHCPGAKYVLKMDDDAFVHIPAMLDFLSVELSLRRTRRLILCDALREALVKRSWRSKWRVSPLEYPAKYYPPYCFGWAILYSPDSVFLLYREAQKEPYFWIDDVHITGTLATKVNLMLTPLHSLALTEKRMKDLLKDPNTQEIFIFGPPNLTEHDIRALWNLVTAKLALKL